MKLTILILLFAGFINAEPIYPDIDFLSEEIVERINSLNTTWKAGKNFDGLSLLTVKKLFMSSEEEVTPITTKPIYSRGYLVEELKNYNSFDSRIKWPKCKSIGQIFDQGLCSPSWVYAAVGQIADRLCIKRKIIDVEATVDYMMKDRYDCNSGFNSADVTKAFQYWQEKVITIAEQKKCLPFSKNCFEYPLNHDKYYSINYYQPTNQSNMQLDILNNGPMTLLIDVYSDLLYYKTGVYQRTSNVKLGSHAVKVIGWGVENGVDYWLIANSWGTKWGDKGFFKIKRGEDGLEIRQSVSTEFDYASAPNSTDRQQIFIKAKQELPKIQRDIPYPGFDEYEYNF